MREMKSYPQQTSFQGIHSAILCSFSEIVFVNEGREIYFIGSYQAWVRGI